MRKLRHALDSKPVQAVVSESLLPLGPAVCTAPGSRCYTQQSRSKQTHQAPEGEVFCPDLGWKTISQALITEGKILEEP